MRRHPPLTPRETQVAKLWAQGLEHSEVAETLGIAQGTLKVHIAKLYLKSGVHNRTKFALWWMNRKAS